ncbi:tripartite tricarboxylate transporter substrate binding protein [Limnohabitans sp. Rim8]|uniref:Bug family tripartite tricarboxylate transporter substrate binding protein n=1 Tax=Limnohabitans sp. Rim8 TaxID=1100718 RepID=UPI002622183C|nr:tripartite tricarboxylate transporter substrate binding protein [Limnohabitans sp. Rim8]
MFQIILTTVTSALLMISGGGAFAQAYPNKPIKIIVPAGPGDSCDILTRLIAPKLTERLGQAIVVDNRAGSAGQLGLTLLKQAPADGYTLGCGQGGNMVIVPLAYAKVAYDSRKDFTPVAMMASNFLALVVSPKTPFKTVKELIDYGKANPGKLTFGTNGEGAFLHFASEQFRMMSGFEYMHVPYKDMNAVFTQMLGGDISASMGSFISVQPLADSGKLRMLGIARATRSPDYPNVPTIAETVPGFASGGWFGIIGPAGVPREITTLLNKEVNWALQQPDVRERMKKLGLEIHTEPPEFFTDLMNKDFDNWGKVVKGMGFKPL